MSIYLNGMGIVAPYDLSTVIDLKSIAPNGESAEKQFCIEPDYTAFFDGRALRRMSKIVKYGSTAGLIALKDAAVEMPDAIIVGTGLGCQEETSLFLKKMIQNAERALNPTPFIFSTHNTIASHIALILKTYTYNNTYSQRDFSFESALIDGLLLIEEGTSNNVLVGGIDELTHEGFMLLKRSGYYKSKGTGEELPAGEGAGFFLLENARKKQTYAKIEFIKAISNTTLDLALKETSAETTDTEIHLLISASSEELTSKIATHFNITKHFNFTHLCGHYATANSFAFGLAAQLLKKEKAEMNILIHNNYDDNHSFILMKNVAD